MHRRQLLIAGGSLMALSACASGGLALTGAAPVADEARIARAVFPAVTPKAELLQPWTGPY